MVWGCWSTYNVLKIVESKYRALRDDDYPDAPNVRMDRVSMLIKLKWRDEDMQLPSQMTFNEPIHTDFCSTDMCHIYAIRIASINFRIVQHKYHEFNESRNYDLRNKKILSWKMWRAVAQNVLHSAWDLIFGLKLSL